MPLKIRIATRKSKLALVQTNMVKKALEALRDDVECELVEMVSDGCYERFSGDLKTVGGKGLFVRNLQQAIVAGDVDIAVHSMKDVPTDEIRPAELDIPCVLPRADRRDVLVCKGAHSLASLPDGAKVGTCSLRRAAQLLANFPHLTMVPIRGNVDTRIEKLESGEVDAIVLAKAGLDRLGHGKVMTDVLEPDIMCPAAGQGIIGVECRKADVEIVELLKKINHEPSFVSMLAEQEMLKTLGADCYSAVGGYCEVTKSGNNLRMIGMAASADGKTVLWSRQKMEYGQHLEIGRAVAEDLLAQGAEALLRPKAA